ncbi:MAG TPA: 6-oxocyclohex-1-ene-1-carbonyl-CoA hydratase, partial [Bacteroidia bacterium]|nr:6-oxocyclohex-1-ene-1-carbonyl-CoA hydratase [Bacteroidia bacterium]
LPLYMGIERAMGSLTLCEPYSAHQAYYFGIITDIVPVLKVNGKFIPNPMVVTDKITDEYGRIVFGNMKAGEELTKAKEIVASAEIDLSLLDAAVNKLTSKLLHTFPNCTMKTISEVRKFKLEHWDKNKESSREWLALNMMSEAKAGFRAFNYGPKNNREIDFVKLRQLLAEGHEWNEDLHRKISPQHQTEKA